MSNKIRRVQDNVPELSTRISHSLVIARRESDKCVWRMQMIRFDQDIPRLVQDAIHHALMRQTALRGRMQFHMYIAGVH